MIAGVGNPDLILVVDRHTLRTHELARLRAVASPLANIFVLGREFLDAIVFAVLRHVQISVRVFDRIGHQPEFTGPVPVNASSVSSSLPSGE